MVAIGFFFILMFQCHLQTCGIAFAECFGTLTCGSKPGIISQ